MTEQMRSLTVSAQAELRALQAELQDVRDRVEHGARHDAAEWLRPGADRARASVLNLLRYLHFRRSDLRLLQKRLSNQGLSSLGRSEVKHIHFVLKYPFLSNRIYYP